MGSPSKFHNAMHPSVKTNVGFTGQTNVSIGQFAEDQACNYLLRQGLHLIFRNYRCRMGEIDLVFRDERNLIFVEVRYRKSSLFGSAAETITYRKRARLIKAASHYIQKYHISMACRFDVVTITPAADKKLSITWIKDAFRVE